MVPAFLLLSGFAVWSRRREGAVLTTALTDCAQRGFLDPAEIPWLSRIPARRFARRYAEKVGGPPARRTMVAYQNAAVELGFLHSRYLRGVAPPDFARSGRSTSSGCAPCDPRCSGPSRPATASRRSSQSRRSARVAEPTAVTHSGHSSGEPPGRSQLERRLRADADHADHAARDALQHAACRWRSPTSRRAGTRARR